MVKTARKEGLMDFYVGIDVSKFKHTVAYDNEISIFQLNLNKNAKVQPQNSISATNLDF